MAQHELGAYAKSKTAWKAAAAIAPALAARYAYLGEAGDGTEERASDIGNRREAMPWSE